MPHIPRCIHQIWVGPNPVPEKSDTFIRDLKRLHSPRFEYRLWTDADVTPENFSNYNWIMKTSCYAQKADIMRYEILYNHGGVYFDIDFEVFRSIEPLLTNDLIVCNEDKHVHKIMTNAFIACTRGNPELKKCVEAVRHVDFSSKSINVTTGPHFFRRCIDLKSAGVTILPTSFIYPVHFNEDQTKPFVPSDTTYARHHWFKSWGESRRLSNTTILLIVFGTIFLLSAVTCGAVAYLKKK